ncbi:phosphoribosylamine--glycine ligase [Candidatus Micrarchaeota archaeon]|nr:phosphoribosylamine--glycine ligase [Candidatus Micrarchaeota archaeon]MBD3417738.1 phosphoribosylamine--glycine ligase [Candidatus Micrarchaeota archaeon]
MKVLLVGSGAREHIIAEQLSRSSELYSIMPKKHPGIASLSEEFLVHDPADSPVVGQWAKSKGVDVAFVSPDGLLAQGVTDTFADLGIPCASPLKKAARIEWDKGYARSLMRAKEIPGCPAIKVASSIDEAKQAISEIGEVAVKPIGLTGGKGVKIAGEHLKSEQDVLSYCAELLEKDGSVLIEEKLDGEEFTLQAFCDGERLALMPPVQDHKRAFENDDGPNTGGMGSYSTGKLLPFLEQKDLDSAKEIMERTLAEMKNDGNPFTGILYGQFMLTKDGIKVIEFNARFGDPEAMNVLSLLKTQLSEVFLSMAEGKLIPVSFASNCTVVKYLVPEGYPTEGKRDQHVAVDEEGLWNSGVKLYFGSVYEKDGAIYTTTSRTAALVGQAEDLEEAEKATESATRFISGPLWHRKDIGTKSLIGRRMEHVRRLKA